MGLVGRIALQKQVTALQQEVARLRDEISLAALAIPEVSGTVEHRINMLRTSLSDEVRKQQERAESAESALLAVREALLFAKEIIDDQAERFHKDCRCQLCESAPMKIDAALSTTSAQAEGIKTRLQAEALNEAAEEMPHIRWKGWLRARAAQFTAKTGEEGGEG